MADEISSLRQLVEKLSLRVTTLENELGLIRAQMADEVQEQPPYIPAPSPVIQSNIQHPNNVFHWNPDQRMVLSEDSKEEKKPTSTSKKSNFVDDGKLYFVKDYTEKSFAIFGKTACRKIEGLTASFRLLYTTKMVFGPGFTGPLTIAMTVLGAISKSLPVNEVVVLSRSEMEKRFGLIQEAK